MWVCEMNFQQKEKEARGAPVLKVVLKVGGEELINSWNGTWSGRATF